MRFGWPGRALLGFAVLDTAWGLRLSTVDPGISAFYGWLDQLMPLPFWSLPWFLVAALCLVPLFRPCYRAAFGGAISIKVYWGGLYLSGQVFGGVADAWPLAAVWLGFAWCVLCIAALSEPIAREGVTWTPPLP